MGISFDAKTYGKVFAAKAANENHINELYSKLNFMSFEDKFRAIQAIDAMKTLNFEYDKYTILYQQQGDSSKNKSTYVVLEGDTLPLIASKIYGDPEKWSTIFNYNDLVDTLLETGTVLNIPSE